MSERRRSRSKVTALPGPVKAEVDRLLATGLVTLDQIIQHLRALADTGAVLPDDVPSRSGLGRYAQTFEKVAARMRMAQEVAERWKTDLFADPESDLGQALLSLLETAVFEAAAETDGATDVDKLELLGRTAKHIAQAKTTGTKRILTLKAEAEREKRRAVEEERQACAARAGEAAREAGLSAARIAELQARVAGLRPAASSAG